MIDEKARTIYVAGAIGDATGITAHQMHALSVDDGSERAGWPVDVSSISSGGVAFMASPQNQRSALSLVNGILYVAYGGHNGDCGNYRGWVVAVDTADPTNGAASSPAGPAAKGSGRQAAWPPTETASSSPTGNNLAGATTHADSEEIVRVTGLGAVDRSSSANVFYPASWQTMDGNDADMALVEPGLFRLAVADGRGGFEGRTLLPARRQEPGRDGRHSSPTGRGVRRWGDAHSHRARHLHDRDGDARGLHHQQQRASARRAGPPARS